MPQAPEGDRPHGSSTPPSAAPRPGAKTDRRQRILDIATEEFAAKGLAGARVDVIATKASCNKNLIYYYFGSKEGLYDEVLAGMLAASQRDMTIPERLESRARLLQRYPGDTPGRRRWLRLLSWEALGGKLTKIVHERQRRETWRRHVANITDLQQRGEVDPGLDAEMLAVATMAINMFPALLPQVTHLITGLSPDDPEFGRRYDALTAQLAERMGPDAAAAAPRGR